MGRSEMKSPSASCQQTGKHREREGAGTECPTRPHRRRWRGCSGKAGRASAHPSRAVLQGAPPPQGGHRGQRQLSLGLCPHSRFPQQTLGKACGPLSKATCYTGRHSRRKAGPRAQRGLPLPADGQPPVRLPRLSAGCLQGLVLLGNKEKGRKTAFKVRSCLLPSGTVRLLQPRTTHAQ